MGLPALSKMARGGMSSFRLPGGFGVLSNVKGYVQAVEKRIDRVDAGLKKACRQGAADWERETKKRVPKVTGAQTYASPALASVLDSAWAEAQRLKDEYLSTEHLLISITENDKGEAGKILPCAPRNGMIQGIIPTPD